MKKGMFFTFIALFMIILIVAIIATKDKYRYREKSNSISYRVKTMNNFIDDYEADLQREIFIGGYRAIIGLNTYVRVIEGYINDLDAALTEILVNGTANQTQVDLMNQSGQGAYIKSWLIRINEESSKLNINVDLKVNEVHIEHIDPWIVQISLNATTIISDTKNIAEWNFTKTYLQEFSILGFEDPLYTVETEDKVTNLINQTPSLDFIGPNNETDVLTNHLMNSYYINSSKAPSFLMRYTGNLSASKYGIESMVNLDELNEQGIAIKQRSVIDYLYFGNQTSTGIGNDYCFIKGQPDMAEWFRIDQESSDFYEITDLDKTVC